MSVPRWSTPHPLPGFENVDQNKNPVHLNVDAGTCRRPQFATPVPPSRRVEHVAMTWQKSIGSLFDKNILQKVEFICWMSDLPKTESKVATTSRKHNILQENVVSSICPIVYHSSTNLQMYYSVYNVHVLSVHFFITLL